MLLQTRNETVLNDTSIVRNEPIKFVVWGECVEEKGVKTSVIEEARHYHSLVDAGYSIEEVATVSGLKGCTVRNFLHILELDPEIQVYIDAGQFPRDAKAIYAIRRVKDSGERIKLVRKLINHSIGAPEVQSVLAEASILETRLRIRRNQYSRPAREIAMKKTKIDQPVEGQQLLLEELIAMTNATCACCEVNSGNIKNPATFFAFEDIVEGADSMCAGCPTRVDLVCKECPLTQMMTQLFKKEKLQSQQLQLVAKKNNSNDVYQQAILPFGSEG
ncbi:MAG: ParB/RepB/Spo0J family partition protein [Bacteroidales bacterium]